MSSALLPYNYPDQNFACESLRLYAESVFGEHLYPFIRNVLWFRSTGPNAPIQLIRETKDNDSGICIDIAVVNGKRYRVTHLAQQYPAPEGALRFRVEIVLLALLPLDDKPPENN